MTGDFRKRTLDSGISNGKKETMRATLLTAVFLCLITSLWADSYLPVNLEPAIIRACTKDQVFLKHWVTVSDDGRVWTVNMMVRYAADEVNLEIAAKLRGVAQAAQHMFESNGVPVQFVMIRDRNGVLMTSNADVKGYAGTRPEAETLKRKVTDEQESARQRMVAGVRSAVKRAFPSAEELFVGTDPKNYSWIIVRSAWFAGRDSNSVGGNPTLVAWLAEHREEFQAAGFRYLWVTATKSGSGVLISPK